MGGVNYPGLNVLLSYSRIVVNGNGRMYGVGSYFGAAVGRRRAKEERTEE